MHTTRLVTISHSIRWGGVCPTPLDADPTDADPDGMQPPLDADLLWMQASSLDADPPG